MPLNSTLKLLLKVLISFGLLALLSTRMDWAAIGRLLGSVNPAGWVGAMTLLFMQILTLGWRWQMMINGKNGTLSYTKALRMTLASHVANLFFISSISGIVVRIALARHHGLSLVRAACATIADRAMTLTALVILATVFIAPASQHMGSFIARNTQWISIIVLTLVVFSLFVFAPLIIQKIISLLKESSRIKEILDYFNEIFSSPSLLFSILLASLINQVFYFIAIFILTRATGINIPALNIIAILPVIILISSLPISIGGWGVREGAFIYGLGMIGVSAESAFLISVQIGLLGTLSVVMAGVPAILHKDIWGILRMKGAKA